MQARTPLHSDPLPAAPLDGRGLLLSHVARQEGVHPATVWRWCRLGVLVAGRRHRLPYLRRGRRIYIEPGAVRDWAASVGAAQREVDEATPAPAPRVRPDPKPAGGRAEAAERRARARLGMAN